MSATGTPGNHQPQPPAFNRIRTCIASHQSIGCNNTQRSWKRQHCVYCNQKIHIYISRSGEGKMKMKMKIIIINNNNNRNFQWHLQRVAICSLKSGSNWKLFGNVSFWGEGKTRVLREKPLRAEKRTNNNLNPHKVSSPGIHPEPRRWEASAITTKWLETENEIEIAMKLTVKCYVYNKTRTCSLLLMVNQF